MTRDWSEDAGHENGNYQNRCLLCDQIFTGHKRRVICKECAMAAAPGPVTVDLSGTTP